MTRAVLVGVLLCVGCADGGSADPAAGPPARSVPTPAQVPDSEPRAPDTTDAILGSASVEPSAPARGEAASTAPPGVPADGRYAVLVGVDDYPGDDADLPSGVHDVRAMRDLLVGRFGVPTENVLVLRDRQATREGIRRAVRDHLGRATDSALLYFSGHGVRLDQNEGEADAERDGRDEAFYVWADDGRHSALVLDDEVGAWLGALGARHLVAVLDACHSGTGARGSAGAPPVKEVGLGDVDDLLDPSAPWRQSAAPAGRPVTLLAAARDRELAFAGHEGEPSLFTGLLTGVLAEAPVDRPLADAVALAARRAGVVARNYGGEQTPQYEGDPRLALSDVFGPRP